MALPPDLMMYNLLFSMNLVMPWGLLIVMNRMNLPVTQLVIKIQCTGKPSLTLLKKDILKTMIPLLNLLSICEVNTMKNCKSPIIILCLLLVSCICFPLYGCQKQEPNAAQDNTSSLTTRYFCALYPSFSLSEAIDLSSTIVYGEITGEMCIRDRGFPVRSWSSRRTPGNRRGKQCSSPGPAP